jgi:hypothetical protein
LKGKTTQYKRITKRKMVNENEPQILAAQIIAAAIDRLTMAVDNSTVEIVEAVDRLSKAAKSPY